jgi:hypothetical protein
MRAAAVVKSGYTPAPSAAHIAAPNPEASLMVGTRTGI